MFSKNENIFKIFYGKIGISARGDVLREGVKVFKSDSLMNQPLDTFNSRAVAGGRRRYRR